MIHQNQIDAANRLIAGFIGEDPVHYAMLLAQMQSGKSDTFMLVGSELVRRGVVERFIVFSGNAEVELKEQAKDQQAFWRNYRAYLRDQQGMTTEEAEEVSERVSEEFSVLWSSDLVKHQTKGNTLYIWDESHYAQSSKQRPDKFFRRQGLQPNGSASENGNKMLSVSATPFSELIDNGEMSQEKFVVKMTPGHDYIGIGKMLEAGAIKGYKGSFQPTLKDLLGKLSDGSTRCVGLIRVTVKTEEEVRKACLDAGVVFYLYDQAWSGAPINELLMDQEFRGVIGLKGKVRMGKQIEKQRVRWCVETANKSNTDTLLQGLMGRCCGYPETGSSLEIEVWMQQSIIDATVMQDYARMMEGEDVIPAPAMNVKRMQKDHYPTIPEKCEISLEGWRSEIPLQEAVKAHILSKDFKSVNEDKFPGSTEDLKKRLTDDASDKEEIKLSNLDFSSFTGYGDRLEQFNREKKLMINPGPSCGVKENELRVWSYGGKPGLGAKTWTVYLQFHTSVATLKATTTKREVFCRFTEEECEVADNGGLTLGLPVDSASKVEIMKAALMEAIEASESCHELVTCSRITSQGTNDERLWQGIAVTESVLKALQPSGSIYEIIQRKCEKTIKIKKTRGRRPANFPEEFVARLSSIEW